MRAAFAWLIAMSVAGCFTPNLGDGAVACGANQLCPPKYFCHVADQRCYKTPDTSVVDMAMETDAGPTEDMSSSDLAGADLAMCTKAACGARNCGVILDGCGGTETCGGGCPAPQTCGGGNAGTRMPNICNGGPACTPKTCGAGECGLMSDGCSMVLNCGPCSGGKICGSDNKCH